MAKYHELRVSIFMLLPNFIIGGTSAAGTSFLTSILLQHEDVYLPREMRPEPHFFYYSHKYEKGLDWYSSKWFSQWSGQKAIGDRSSSYLYDEKSADRIKTHLPNAKLIFVLRNPSERAWANYRYTVLSGLDPLTFEEALENEDKRIKEAEGIWSEVQPHDYTGRSFYGKQIDYYLKKFDREQILILSSENLRDDTRNQVLKITNFLDIDPLKHFETPVLFTSISVKDPKVQVECREILEADKFNEVVESVRLEEKDISKHCSSTEEKKAIEKLQKNLSRNKNPLDEKLRLKLNDLFRQDQKLLFSLIGESVDFDPWF